MGMTFVRTDLHFPPLIGCAGGSVDLLLRGRSEIDVPVMVVVAILPWRFLPVLRSRIRPFRACWRRESKLRALRKRDRGELQTRRNLRPSTPRQACQSTW